MNFATNLVTRFKADTSGVSAVEFAVLMPVMTLLLLGSFDIARAITVKAKTSQLAATVSDFVSQNQTISKDGLTGIVAASTTVLYPFPDTGLKVRVESIIRDPNDASKYVIDWYYEKTAGSSTPVTKGQNTNIPGPSMTPTDASTTMAIVSYTYNLKFAGFLGERFGRTSFEMTSSAHNSPRWGTPVTTTGLDN